jgi:hypothetical protein
MTGAMVMVMEQTILVLLVLFVPVPLVPAFRMPLLVVPGLTFALDVGATTPTIPTAPVESAVARLTTTPRAT